MSIMGTDRHYSSHLPDRAAPSVLTLPGVAELLSSSRPSTTDSLPAHHHIHPSNHPRFAATAPPPPDSHYSRSSPPRQYPFKPASSAPAVSEPQFYSAANHASQSSPIDTHTATSPLDHQQQHHYYYPPATQSVKPPPYPPSNVEANQYPQDTAHSQTPGNTRRQDSAISQRPEIAKDSQPTAPPSDHLRYYSHQSPRDVRNSISPTLNSHSVSPTSPHSAAVTAPPSHISHEAGTYPTQRGHTKSVSTDHFSTEAPRSHEPVTPAAIPITSHQDSHSNNASTSTRQRYNVRFAANHTPDNMPSFPKPRSDNPPTPTTTDTTENAPSPKEQDAPAPSPAPAPTPTPVEPAIQIINNVSNVDQPPQAQARNKESSVERCAVCGTTWSRPLPDSFSSIQPSAAGEGKGNSFTQSSLSILTKLQQHGKKADEDYNEWKWIHSHCVKNGVGHRSTSPYHGAASNRPHSPATNGAVQEHGKGYSGPQKRKAEQLAGDDQNGISKHRRIGSEPVASATTPPPPSTSA